MVEHQTIWLSPICNPERMWCQDRNPAGEPCGCDVEHEWVSYTRTPPALSEAAVEAAARAMVAEYLDWKE
jgi:hypothetical protein